MIWGLWGYSHARVSVRVVELHLRTGLYPSHCPRLVPGHRWHYDPGGGSEVGRSISQHNGRVLLHHCGAPVDWCWHLVHHDVFTAHTRLTHHALEAAHGPTYEERECKERRQEQDSSEPYAHMFESLSNVIVTFALWRIANIIVVNSSVKPPTNTHTHTQWAAVRLQNLLCRYAAISEVIFLRHETQVWLITIISVSSLNITCSHFFLTLTYLN